MFAVVQISRGHRLAAAREQTRREQENRAGALLIFSRRLNENGSPLLFLLLVVARALSHPLLTPRRRHRQIEVKCEFCKRDYILEGKELEDAYAQSERKDPE